MKKINIFVIKIKKNFISIIVLLFTACLVVFSSSNLQAAKSGLKLWANSVVPSLFPFFIATELLSKTNIPKFFGKIFNKIMKPLFNISGEGSFALIMGLISGYPVGAKLCVNFRKNNICTKEECERLLAFTNNSGPLFILGVVGVSLFGSFLTGLVLLFTHILACLTVGFIFRFWNKNNKPKIIYNTSEFENKLQPISVSTLGENLASAISSATSTIFMIGGFVVLFSVIISSGNVSGITNMVNMLFRPICSKFNIPSELSSSLFTGFLEITNGINLISKIKLKKISINIILTAFLLGIGGISVLLQVLSIVSKSDLSIKPYIIGKLLHGIIAAVYTFLLISSFPILNLNL